MMACNMTIPYWSRKCLFALAFLVFFLVQLDAAVVLNATLPEPSPNVSSSPPDSLLALNSTADFTQGELFAILGSLLMEEHEYLYDDVEISGLPSAGRSRRNKRDVANCPGVNETRLAALTPQLTNSSKRSHCYDIALRKCGYILINAYHKATNANRRSHKVKKSKKVKNKKGILAYHNATNANQRSHKVKNKKDILAEQCYIRSYFFDCFREQITRLNCATKYEAVKQSEWLDVPRLCPDPEFTTTTAATTTTTFRLNGIKSEEENSWVRPRFCHCLGLIIWDSRVCVNQIRTLFVKIG